MFDNFKDFKNDFMEKIGDLGGFSDKVSQRYDIKKRRYTSVTDPTIIVTKQSKTTATRGYGDNCDWRPSHGEYDEDFSIVRHEIIEAVQHFYQIGITLTNRFISASEGYTKNDWISIDEDSYTDYYDAGVTQTLEIDLSKLFDLIKNKNGD